MKLEKIFLLLGVSLFLVSNCYAEQACSDCYAAKRLNCEKRCQGSSTRIAFSSCADSCVAESCGRYCNATVSSSSSSSAGLNGGYADPDSVEFLEFPNVGGLCGKCLRSASSKVCISRCPGDKVEDPALCRKSCAKLECATSCQLPDEKPETDKDKRPTARDCGECKRFGQGACNVQCDPQKYQPGYTTCVVSCIENRCLDICNPE